jgi:hypothetical protein
MKALWFRLAFICIMRYKFWWGISLDYKEDQGLPRWGVTEQPGVPHAYSSRGTTLCIYLFVNFFV